MSERVEKDGLLRQNRILKKLRILQKTTSNLGFAYVNPKASTRRNLKPGFYVKNSRNFWKHVELKSFMPPVVNESEEMPSNDRLLDEGHAIVGQLQALELRLAYYAKQVSKCKIGIATELVHQRTGKLRQKFTEAKDFFSLLSTTAINSEDESGATIGKPANNKSEVSLSDSSSDESDDSSSDSEREDGEMSSDEEVPKRIATPTPAMKPNSTTAKTDHKPKENPSSRQGTPEKNTASPPQPHKKPKEKVSPSKEPPFKKKKKSEKQGEKQQQTSVASTSKEQTPPQRSEDPSVRRPTNGSKIIKSTVVCEGKLGDPRTVRTTTCDANSSTYQLTSMPSADQILAGPSSVADESLLAKLAAIEKERDQLKEEKELREMRDQRERMNDKRRRSHR